MLLRLWQGRFLLSASHHLLIPFHKELDERTLENLPDPQSLPSLDLDEVESSLDDTIVGLGPYGMCLCHLLAGTCLLSERSPHGCAYPPLLPTAVILRSFVLSVFMTIMNGLETSGGRLHLPGLNNIVINLIKNSPKLYSPFS